MKMGGGQFKTGTSLVCQRQNRMPEADSKKAYFLDGPQAPVISAEGLRGGRVGTWGLGSLDLEGWSSSPLRGSGSSSQGR